MLSQDHIHPEAETLIQRALDHELDVSGQKHLAELMKNDAALRRHYLENCYLDSLLDTGVARREMIPFTSSPQPVVRKKTFAKAALAIAALVLLGLFAHNLLKQPEAPNSISIAGSPGARWNVAGTGSKHPDTLPSGKNINLVEGFLELRFPGGSHAIVEAPAAFQASNSHHLKFTEGSAFFDLTPADTGLRVSLPGLELIDHGTKFAIECAPDTTREIHVFEGAVAVTSDERPEEEFLLEKRQALRVKKSDGVTDVARIDANPRFTMKFPTSNSYLHWTFDGFEEAVLPVTGDLASHTRAQGSLTGNPGDPQPEVIRGKIGNALRFDGNSQHISTQLRGLDPTAPHTVAFWFRQENNRDAPYFVSLGGGASHPDSNQLIWALTLNNSPGPEIPTGVPLLKYGDSVAWIDRETHDNNWRHLTVSWDLNTDSPPVFYLNGTLQETRIRNWPPKPSRPDDFTTHFLSFGTLPADQTGSRFIEGNIDDVWLFAKTLAPEDVRKLTKAQAPSPDK